MKLKVLLKLVRIKNLLMVFFTLLLTKYALIKSYKNLSNSNHQEFLLLCLSILFITAAGYVINDIFDIKTDSVNKPTRLIVSNTIAKKEAWTIYGFLSFLGILLGIYLSFLKGKPHYSFIFIFTSIGLYLYASFLKSWPFIGNVLIAFFVSFTIYTVTLFETVQHFPSNILTAFGQFFTSISINTTVFIYLIFSFLSTLIREIIKDIEDIKGDYAQKMNTLPILLGTRRTNKIAVFFTILLVLFLLMVCKGELIKFPYFLTYIIVFLVIPLAYFLYRLWLAKKTAEYHFLSVLLKIIMCFGILSMLFFRF